jgi:hypothetical protein
MTDKRRRAYYTNGQITKGLLTDGGQWMLVDGTEYKGQYHTYITGEVFTEASFVNGVSKTLIPYVDLESVSEQGIDFGKNFEYDNIKNVVILESSTPNPKFIQPTNKDKINGYMVRLFAQKVNDKDVLIEINEDDMKKLGTSKGMDENLYKTFSLRWKVTGPDDDVLDSAGNIVESGIAPTNKRTIDLKSEEFPALKKYLKDFTEFSF